MKEKLVDKLTEFMTAAFGLVAALAWNGAIQQIFKNVFGEQSSVAAMLFYAIVVTIIAVIAITYIGKAGEKAKTITLRRRKE